jgi:tripartite-type tricarboxylate transporter receptor subunit TctC
LVDTPAESLHILATKLHTQPAFQRVQGLATVTNHRQTAAINRQAGLKIGCGPLHRETRLVTAVTSSANAAAAKQAAKLWLSGIRAVECRWDTLLHKA